MSPVSYPNAETLPRAIVLGCAGTVLDEAERRFFREFDPLGFILFQRNCENPDQVRALTASLRECVGREDAPILIDQEGGRVARLKPPHWPKFPPMRVFGELYAKEPALAQTLCFDNAFLIAYELARLGIDVDCAPVVDLPVPGAHDVIGDRAFGTDPAMVIELAGSVCSGLQAGGVIPIIKHIPGHGRAGSDSHKELPTVEASRDELERTDLEPFRLSLSRNVTPWAMVAHVRYPALDPDHAASVSRRIVEDIIRISIGFSGVLIADDIGMEALSGSFAERAAATLACGNDLTLHCSGKIDEMKSFAGSVRRITPDTHARLAAASYFPAHMRRTDPVTHERAQQVRDRLRELIPGYAE